MTAGRWEIAAAQPGAHTGLVVPRRGARSRFGFRTPRASARRSKPRYWWANVLGLDLPIAPMACVLSERLQADALASLVKRVGMLKGHGTARPSATSAIWVP